MTEVIVVGLGGNVGGEQAIVARFRSARGALAELCEADVRSAPLYRTAPLGSSLEQSAFLNSALGFRMVARPRELLAHVLEIERALGRDRNEEQRWGPRAIDLDLLVWGERTIQELDLAVPHPRLAARRFALEPLAALLGAPFVVPGFGSVGALLERVRDQRVERISDGW